MAAAVTERGSQGRLPAAVCARHQQLRAGARRGSAFALFDGGFGVWVCLRGAG